MTEKEVNKQMLISLLKDLSSDEIAACIFESDKAYEIEMALEKDRDQFWDRGMYD